MENLYIYLLLGLAVGCAAGGLVGWWLRKQGEASRQHDVEVYYREALKISESARDRAREEADQLGERIRVLREEHETRAVKLDELRSVLKRVQQAGSDSSTRMGELEDELQQLRGRLKERESAVARLQKGWKAQEAKQAASAGHGEVEKLQAELRAVHEAHSSMGAEADRLRQRVHELESELARSPEQPPQESGLDDTLDFNGALGVQLHGNGPHPVQASGNGAGPSWLLDSAEGDQDDLQSIHGLGPVFERGLNELGVFYFRQIAGMTREDVEWIAPRLNIHPARILRDDWASQARECHRRKYKEKL